jgi:hypothetical protein
MMTRGAIVIAPRHLLSVNLSAIVATTGAGSIGTKPVFEYGHQCLPPI